MADSEPTLPPTKDKVLNELETALDKAGNEISFDNLNQAKTKLDDFRKSLSQDRESAESKGGAQAATLPEIVSAIALVIELINLITNIVKALRRKTEAENSVQEAAQLQKQLKTFVAELIQLSNKYQTNAELKRISDEVERLARGLDRHPVPCPALIKQYLLLRWKSGKIITGTATVAGQAAFLKEQGGKNAFTRTRFKTPDGISAAELKTQLTDALKPAIIQARAETRQQVEQVAPETEIKNITKAEVEAKYQEIAAKLEQDLRRAGDNIEKQAKAFEKAVRIYETSFEVEQLDGRAGVCFGQTLSGLRSQARGLRQRIELLEQLTAAQGESPEEPVRRSPEQEDGREVGGGDTKKVQEKQPGVKAPLYTATFVNPRR